MVKEYFKRGFKVIATCRNPEKADNLASFLKESHLPEAIVCDVGSEESIKKCVSVIEASGIDKVDLLVNNAGMSNRDHPDDLANNTDRSEMVNIFDVNVGGPLSMTNAIMSLLEKSSAPTVINISSLLGSMTASSRFNTTSYQCSKAALNMLTKCQADAFKNVKFVSVHPGWVQTDMGSAKNRSPPVPVEVAAAGVADVADKAQESGSFWGFDGKQITF